MTPERWQQISRIFKSAISLNTEARAAYVADQCGTDESLRSEVEKLIESHQQASDENFIGGHAAEDGAVLLTGDVEEHQPRLRKGQKLGAYEILDLLGAGGMGEVYRARDSRLERMVALKVLSPDISADKRRMQRFRQEAKVASSLNQSNILTIFEFGEIDGLIFLATEFIDGQTLRDYLHGKRLKLAETLDIGIQVLTALDAAHEARIVHRDIKPENVMIRHRDGVVKVLDFGLAKVTERKSQALAEHESEAATEVKTAPGILMGTVNYMSPEQARTMAVDERTDIWSVGVMLYEMVTGLLPFGGPTTSHTLVQILEKETPAFPKVADAPAELQRIIRKALAKSVGDRYQTSKDMLIDLKSLRKELDHGPGRETAQTEKKPDRKRVLAIALVAMVVVTAGFLGWSIWRAAQSRSSSVVGPAAPPVVAPAPERTLTYSITVQKFRNNREYEEPFTLAGEMIFEADYRIRLNVQSPQTGHLYVLNEGPPEGTAPVEFVALFPSPTANKGSTLLTANTQVKIPDPTWLRFDAQQGVEKIWLVFAPDAVPELEAIRPYVNATDVGLIRDVALNKAIGSFLLTHSAVKHEQERSNTETTLKAWGKLLVYPIKLEHH